MVFDAKRGIRHARRQGAKITRTSQGIVVGDSEVSEKVATGLKELGYVERTTRARGGGVARTLVKLSATEVDLKVLLYVQEMDTPHNPLFISRELGLSELAVTRSLERQARKVPNLKRNGNQAWRWVNIPSPVSQEPSEPPTAVTEPSATKPTPTEVPAPTEPVVPISADFKGAGSVSKATLPWMQAHPGEHTLADVAAATGIPLEKIRGAFSFNHNKKGQVEPVGHGRWRWAGPVANGHVLPPPPPPPAFAVINGTADDWSARLHWDKVLLGMDVDDLAAVDEKSSVLSTAVDAVIKKHHTDLPERFPGERVPAQLFMFHLRELGLVTTFGTRWHLTDKWRMANPAQRSMYLDQLVDKYGMYPGAPKGPVDYNGKVTSQGVEQSVANLEVKPSMLHLDLVGISALGKLYRDGDAYYLVSQFVVP